MSSPIRFLLTFGFTTALLLVPAIVFNYRQVEQHDLNAPIALEASQWQQRTGHAITVSLPLNSAFKHLRLDDRLDEIDTLVLGSSTAMGIDESMLSEGAVAYNLSQYGHTTAGMAEEAEYVMRAAPRLETLVWALDWSMGAIFKDRLTENYVPIGELERRRVPVPERLKEAAALHRFLALPGIARERLSRAPSEESDEDAEDVHVCPDGTVTRNYGTLVGMGKCSGFKTDGSSSFEFARRMSPEVLKASLEAVTQKSNYAVCLARTRGVPHPLLLERIGRVGRELQARGGRLVLLLPPVMPGLEQRLLEQQPSGAHLEQMKSSLDEWAKAEGYVILDAGRSELFGCASSGFHSPNHALPSCLEKVFEGFWADLEAGRLSPGLHPTLDG